MSIFIAYNYESKIINIVLAKSQELATVYWQGKNIKLNSIRELKETDLLDHITGVIPILNTSERSFDTYSGIKKAIVVDKG